MRSRGKAGGDKGRVAGRKQHDDNTGGIKTEEVVVVVVVVEVDHFYVKINVNVRVTSSKWVKSFHRFP